VEINHTNIEQLLPEPLLHKLPTSHYDSDFPDKLENTHLSSIYARDLNILVDSVMSKIFRESPGAESFTSDTINVFILQMISLAQRLALGCSNLDFDRNRQFILNLLPLERRNNSIDQMSQSITIEYWS
jgi:hypothetical protein